MRLETLNQLAAELVSIGCVTVSFAFAALTALLLAKLLERAERSAKDPWLWRLFRWAALSLAGIHLALLLHGQWTHAAARLPWLPV